MKLKTFLKALGLSLFLVALILFMLSQNPKVEPIGVLYIVAFGTVLAFSAACLITGELIGKNENLEERIYWLEEEIRKLKENQNKEK